MTNCSLVALHNEVIGRHFVLKVKVFSVEKRERRRPTVFETQRKTGRYRHNRRGFVFEERLQKKRRRKQKQKKKKRNDTGTNFRLNDDANVQKKNRKESKKTTQQKQPNECILFLGGGGLKRRSRENSQVGTEDQGKSLEWEPNHKKKMEGGEVGAPCLQKHKRRCQ